MLFDRGVLRYDYIAICIHMHMHIETRMHIYAHTIHLLTY